MKIKSISYFTAGERARKAVANARHSNGFNSPSMVGINSETVG
jgi:hypothetical protein